MFMLSCTVAATCVSYSESGFWAFDCHYCHCYCCHRCYCCCCACFILQRTRNYNAKSHTMKIGIDNGKLNWLNFVKDMRRTCWINCCRNKNAIIQNGFVQTMNAYTNSLGDRDGGKERMRERLFELLKSECIHALFSHGLCLLHCQPFGTLCAFCPHYNDYFLPLIGHK